MRLAILFDVAYPPRVFCIKTNTKRLVNESNDKTGEERIETNFGIYVMSDKHLQSAIGYYWLKSETKNQIVK